MASERGEPPPGSPGPSSSVGYHVRLDAAVTRHTRLLFCTTGILLRRLASDPLLSGLSHIVVDEVHERTMQGDFLMALLRALVARRRAAGRPLKVVLMSATLDAALFASYFGGCPVVAAAGRTFPVTQLFLEDVYEATGYVLAPDSPAARRRGRGDRGGAGSGAVARAAAAGGDAARAALFKSGWGDEEADAGPLNPEYDGSLYAGYGTTVRASLARLDEERIDFDLVEVREASSRQCSVLGCALLVGGLAASAALR